MWAKLILSACLLFSFSSPSFAANDEVDQLVKIRQKAFKQIERAQKQLAKLRKRSNYDTQKAVTMAEAIADRSAKLLEFFPPDSINSRSESLPEIWENWDDFAAMMDEMTMLAQRIAREAQAGQNFQQAYTLLDKSCDKCHDAYRD